jgi:hypothetical protein
LEFEQTLRVAYIVGGHDGRVRDGMAREASEDEPVRPSAWALSVAVAVVAVCLAPRLLLGLVVAIPLAAVATVRYPAESDRRDRPESATARPGRRQVVKEVVERALLLPELGFIAVVVGPELREGRSGALRRSFGAQPVALRVLALVLFGALLGYCGQRLWRELPWWRGAEDEEAGGQLDDARLTAAMSPPDAVSGHRLGEAIYLGVASIPLFVLGTPASSAVVVALLYLGPLLLARVGAYWTARSVHLGLAQRAVVHWAFVVSRPTHRRPAG